MNWGGGGGGGGIIVNRHIKNDTNSCSLEANTEDIKKVGEGEGHACSCTYMKVHM